MAAAAAGVMNQWNKLSNKFNSVLEITLPGYRIDQLERETRQVVNRSECYPEGQHREEEDPADESDRSPAVDRSPHGCSLIVARIGERAEEESCDSRG